MSPLLKILVPLDFSESCGAALAIASELATHFDSTLCALHVIPFLPPIPTDLVVTTLIALESDEERLEKAQNRLEALLAQHLSEQIRVRPLVKMGHTAHEIACAAEEEGADLIVLSMHVTSGWKQLFGTAIAEKVLHLAPCPVLAIPRTPSSNGHSGNGPMPQTHKSLLPIQTILCPLDESESALAALGVATMWAQHFGASLDVLHVVPTISEEISPGVYAAPEYNRIWLDEEREKLGALITAHVPRELGARPLVTLGNVEQGIARNAQAQHADLIVLTTHGYTGWRHLLHGSVAERVADSAQIPLLILRASGR